MDLVPAPVDSDRQAPVLFLSRAAEKAAEWITENGIMFGNSAGDLMLDQGMTRKQFAVMLYRYHQKFHPT